MLFLRAQKFLFLLCGVCVELAKLDILGSTAKVFSVKLPPLSKVRRSLLCPRQHSILFLIIVSS